MSQINAKGVPGPLPEDRRCGAHRAIRVRNSVFLSGVTPFPIAGHAAEA
jgi:hypothetical protein